MCYYKNIHTLNHIPISIPREAEAAGCSKFSGSASRNSPEADTTAVFNNRSTQPTELDRVISTETAAITRGKVESQENVKLWLWCSPWDSRR